MPPHPPPPGPVTGPTVGVETGGVVLGDAGIVRENPWSTVRLSAMRLYTGVCVYACPDRESPSESDVSFPEFAVDANG